jgi:hypothetical protein
MDFGDWVMVVLAVVVIGGAFAVVLWPRKGPVPPSTSTLYGDSSEHGPHGGA